jgi:potassium channel
VVVAVPVLRLLRLWRLQRVGALFARLEKDVRVNYIWVRLDRLVGVTLFAVHQPVDGGPLRRV